MTVLSEVDSVVSIVVSLLSIFRVVEGCNGELYTARGASSTTHVGCFNISEDMFLRVAAGSVDITVTIELPVTVPEKIRSSSVSEEFPIETVTGTRLTPSKRLFTVPHVLH
jgi:hypothetical protein